MPGGAKGRYRPWLENDGLILLQGWARDGLTDEQIAKKVGVTATTLYDWKNRFPEIAKALKNGKEVVDYAVESALLKKAQAGDVAAMIFWLRNRRRGKWSNNPEMALPKDDRQEDALSLALRKAVEDEEVD